MGIKKRNNLTLVFYSGERVANKVPNKSIINVEVKGKVQKVPTKSY
jgi:hypothetical protein